MALHTILFWLARQDTASASVGLMSHHHHNNNGTESGIDMPTHVMLSNIAGSLSILCWFIVFTPQFWINYKRQSGESLSLPFLYIWLAGDFLNVAGATMDNLLLTMRVLAWYYTIADILLIAQVYYYRRTSARSRFEFVIASSTPHSNRPASSTSSSSSSSSLSSSDDDEQKSLLATSATDKKSNYLSVIPTAAAKAGSSYSSSWSETMPFSTSPSAAGGGGISFSQEQDQHLQQQLAQDRIRYQAAQAANSIASTSTSSFTHNNNNNNNPGDTTTTIPPPWPTGPYCDLRRASEAACSTRTTASERLQFLEKRRSVRQWILIILPVLATVFFIGSYIEWRNCVLGEVGKGGDTGSPKDGGGGGLEDGIGNADEWWGWTQCGRGHGRGKLPPVPNTPSPSVAPSLLLWETSSNRTIVQLMSSSGTDSVPLPPPSTSPPHHHHRKNKKNAGDGDGNDSGSWAALMLGWGSAALYLGSRIPQLYKNWRLKSCEGLSIMMFLFSVFGNALYIFLQFYLYRHNKPMDDAIQEAAATGELVPEAAQSLLVTADEEDHRQKAFSSS
ncbi:hypothetical protein BGX33_011935, partial [Mortierella sp. NVP41]